ncbi:MAG: RNA methyltransferase [Alphaproteobacteria bacterium]
MNTDIAVILCRPQLGENIGLAARAMGNFGIKDLRIVCPRDPWPNTNAIHASVSAREIVDKAGVFCSLKEAIADLEWALCTTARPRYLKKSVYALKDTPSLFQAHPFKKIGFVFGPEQAGLTNEEISLCNGSIYIETSPDCPSLNLSHAVLLCMYELARVTNTHPIQESSAEMREVFSLLSYLELSLEKNGFFSPEEKRDKMKQNLRDIFLRRPLSVHDVNTLFGVFRCLGKPGDSL